MTLRSALLVLVLAGCAAAPVPPPKAPPTQAPSLQELARVAVTAAWETVYGTQPKAVADAIAAVPVYWADGMRFMQLCPGMAPPGADDGLPRAYACTMTKPYPYIAVAVLTGGQAELFDILVHEYLHVFEHFHRTPHRDHNEKPNWACTDLGTGHIGCADINRQSVQWRALSILLTWVSSPMAPAQPK